MSLFHTFTLSHTLPHTLCLACRRYRISVLSGLPLAPPPHQFAPPPQIVLIFNTDRLACVRSDAAKRREALETQLRYLTFSHFVSLTFSHFVSLTFSHFVCLTFSHFVSHFRSLCVPLSGTESQYILSHTLSHFRTFTFSHFVSHFHTFTLPHFPAHFHIT